MELSIEKFKKYVDNEFSLEQLEALEDIKSIHFLTMAFSE